MSELEKLLKRPINIGGEHSIGFILPKRWADELGLTPEKEAVLIREEDRIIIQPGP